MEELLVCKGRLENSDLEVGQKCPIILPKDHQLTEVIVLDCHKKVRHCNVGCTLLGSGMGASISPRLLTLYLEMIPSF